MEHDARNPAVPTRIGDVPPSRLRDMVNAPLHQHGFELVECKWVARQKTISISIDHTAQQAADLGLDPTRSGISLDDCQAASHAISAVLDGQPPFSGDEEWTLEVSSPGVERPLLTSADFKRFSGLAVRVKIKRDAAKQYSFASPRRLWLDATLEGCDEHGIRLRGEHESMSIALEDVERAHLQMAF